MPFISVPNTGQSLGQTRDQIRNNIDDIKDALEVNHEPLDTGQVGKHSLVEIRNNGFTGPYSNGQYTLYTDTSNQSSTPQLFGVSKNLNSRVQLTEDLTNTIPITTQNGATFLAGQHNRGCTIFQWGFVNSTTSGTVTYNVPFPTQVFNIQTTAFFSGAAPNNLATVSVKEINLSSFSWKFHTDSGAYAGFYWTAIGY